MPVPLVLLVLLSMTSSSLETLPKSTSTDRSNPKPPPSPSTLLMLASTPAVFTPRSKHHISHATTTTTQPLSLFGLLHPPPSRTPLLTCLCTNQRALSTLCSSAAALTLRSRPDRSCSAHSNLVVRALRSCAAFVASASRRRSWLVRFSIAERWRARSVSSSWRQFSNPGNWV